MLFITILMGLLMLASLTFASEYSRTKSLTLLSLISLGNVLYMGVVPALYSHSREDALIFESYVHDAGLTVSEDGLVRVLVAAALFQLVCLLVSLGLVAPRNSIRPDAITDQNILRAAIRWGWVLVYVGVLGVIWIGINHSGSPLGLYQITYAERASRTPCRCPSGSPWATRARP